MAAKGRTPGERIRVPDWNVSGCSHSQNDNIEHTHAPLSFRASLYQNSRMAKGCIDNRDYLTHPVQNHLCWAISGPLVFHPTIKDGLTIADKYRGSGQPSTQRSQYFGRL
jgi:hypothetical protein